MNYLLDTHIVLWWLSEPSKITPKARSIIENNGNSIFVSSVSFWEMAIKRNIGKLHFPSNIIETLKNIGFTMLPILPEEALCVSDLPLLHQDPFDRMLIIQAKLNDLVFITRDEKLSEYQVVTILG